MTRQDAENAVFGSFDGLTTSVGVVGALTFAGHSASAIVVAALAAALASAIGMGAGKWLSDSDEGFRESSVIAVATAAGGVLPAAPYLVAGSSAAFLCALVASAAMAAGIGHLRGGGLRRYAETYGVLAAVVAVTVTVGGAA